jgi:SagB-type dehydrogenase family enzyme
VYSNRNIEKAINFHELTKHSYVSVRTRAHRLDWGNRPYPFKIYRKLPFHPLPHDFPKPENDTLQALKTTWDMDGVRLDLKTLASLLFFTAGITRVKIYPEGSIFFRAAPATGALYPVEIYVVAGDVDGLEDGVYHFSPDRFGLTQIRRGDYRWELGVNSSQDVWGSQVSLVFTSIGWRNAWKYTERSYRHWFWDSGVMVANLVAAASALNVGSRLVMGFVDSAVNRLVAVDGRREASILVVPMGKTSIQPVQPTEAVPLTPETLPLSKREVEYPEIYEIHGASSLAGVNEVAEWVRTCQASSQEWEVDSFNPDGGLRTQPLWQTILRRGSTRVFSKRPISDVQLKTILACCSDPINADFLPPKSSYISIYLIANSVEGLRPGAYFFNRVTGGLELLKAGEFRKVAGYLCLEQVLGADASAVFFLMTPLKRVLERMGNRGYRVVQLEAGIIAGRMYLASYGQGLGATGLTFYDDDVTEFFSPHARGKSNMLVVAVGVPAYRSRPGDFILDIGQHTGTGPL